MKKSCMIFFLGKNSFPSIIFIPFIASLFLITGCNKESPATEAGVEALKAAVANETTTESFKSSNLSHATLQELMQARAATARYHNIENALADGYENINVVLPNMGYHFMKTTWVDATFEVTKPEILVYNKQENGRMQLVAVEYAVPLNLSANAPAGFTGNQDVWTANTGFGLWLLHAWIWYENPDGVFNATNPAVHLH
jgi:hypothetical protein